MAGAGLQPPVCDPKACSQLPWQPGHHLLPRHAPSRPKDLAATALFSRLQKKSKEPYTAEQPGEGGNIASS